MCNGDERRHTSSVPAPEADSEGEYAIRLDYLRAAIQKGLDDVAAGRVVDGKVVFRRLLERLK